MSQKKTKQTNKHTVKEVLASLQWSVEKGKLLLCSPITDEFVTINLSAINQPHNGTVEQAQQAQQD